MLADGWLGRYKIIRKIGTGGMGEVYLGEDSKLNRKIALKTLPSDVAADSERMHRFTHEAKSASALNHPNIITIYEINDEGEAPFIAMEYVEGETLGKIIKREPPDLPKAIDIAVQVAGALAAAHEANVVHRDVKPDNIIVRPDGLVKVLDFGLAKLTENDASSDPEAETIAHRTNPGMIIGTASYMSPEQARGKQVDGRSDIFSFGTVLYQLLTGKLPFVGENYVDVIALILHQEPAPLSEFVPGIPREIDAVVRKCLRKDRDERFQSMRELLADLKDIQHGLGLVSRSGESAAAASDPGRIRTTNDALAWGATTDRHSRFLTGSISKMLLSEVRLHPIRVMAIMAVLVGGLGFAGFGLKKLGDASTTADAFQKMRFLKVTTSGRVVTELTALSPDGKFVAYISDDAGRESMWVKQAETQAVVPAVLSAKVRYKGLTISPDAKYIYYITQDPPNPSVLHQVPVLGGSARKLITNLGGPIAFSPDGSQISFFRGETSLMIAKSDGSSERLLATGQNGEQWTQSTWSPDAKKLMAVVFSPAESKYHLIEVNVEDGSQRPASVQPWLAISGLAWLPEGNGLVVAGRDFETQRSQVWFISYPDGDVRRVTNDPNSYLGLSLSSDGRAIASVQLNRLANIWSSSPSNFESAFRITSDLGRDEGMSGVSWTPDDRIVYTVREGGKQDLWITNRDGSDKKQLTFNAGANFSPAVSPDGQKIVFVSTRGGSPNIWRMDINGDNQSQMTNHSGVAGEPEISPDGNWVVYDFSPLDNTNSIWKVSINGGEPIQLTKSESGRPEISPNGEFIACDYGEYKPGSSPKIAIIPFEGGEPKQIFEFPKVLKSRVFRWSNDGKSLLYMDSVDKVVNIWSQPLDAGPARQLTSFTSDRIFRFDVSRKDGSLALSRGNETSDVVMLTDFR